jgi:hypothetical protein
MEDVDAAVRKRLILIHSGPVKFEVGEALQSLLRVTFKSGETWAVDTTGTQYGYPETLSPWKEYKRQRTESVARTQEFGKAYTNATANQDEHMEFSDEKPLEEMVAELIPLWA